MVRTAHGRLTRLEEEDGDQRESFIGIDGDETTRQAVVDPYGDMAVETVKQAVEDIRLCSEAIRNFSTVEDFLVFSDSTLVDTCSYATRCSRMTMLENACLAVDWLNSKEPEGGKNTMTFVEVCQHFGVGGADPETLREIINHKLMQTDVMSASFCNKLSYYLSEIVGE